MSKFLKSTWKIRWNYGILHSVNCFCWDVNDKKINIWDNGNNNDNVDIDDNDDNDNGDNDDIDNNTNNNSSSNNKQISQ